MKILMISRSTLMSAPGGDTVQVLETAAHLRKLEIEVDVLLAEQKIDYTKYDLIHFFNVIRPADILGHIAKSKLPYVVSTIYVDYSISEGSSRGFIFRIINFFVGSDGAEYLKAIARYILNNEKINSWEYLFIGHRASVKKVIANARLLLPNSESEYRRLASHYGLERPFVAVPNAINPQIFKLNKSTKRDGVLCVARIEPLKNQLNLIKAMNRLPFGLTIIGTHSPNHESYYRLCKKEAASNIKFVDHVSQPELSSYYNHAKVHILPSWFETTGLSSLEAAACGCNIVVTPHGDTREYFGDNAVYCMPDDVQSIADSICKANNAVANYDFSELIIKKYIWSETARITLRGYIQALGRETVNNNL